MNKFIALLQSRKFWALAGSVVALATAYQSGSMSAAEVANALVAALAVFSLATGIEDSKRTA
jgi:hypothetical protein